MEATGEISEVEPISQRRGDNDVAEILSAVPFTWSPVRKLKIDRLFRSPFARRLLGTMLALHLLQNTLVYINTLMIQRVLSETAWATRLMPEDFRALTPLMYGHINPYGTFELDMKRRLDLEPLASAIRVERRAKPVTVPQGNRRDDPQLALFDAAF